MSSSIAVNQACTPNIGTVERRKRLAGGVVAFLIALANFLHKTLADAVTRKQRGG